MIEERDLRIRMRDGVRLAVDVYRMGGRGSETVTHSIHHDAEHPSHRCSL
jgi:uncharacterized protein